MLSKCANPECSSRFRYLRDGKLVHLEIDPRVLPGTSPQLVSEKKPAHKLEHFWLCGACCATMTLAVERGKGVVAVPLNLKGQMDSGSGRHAQTRLQQ